MSKKSKAIGALPTRTLLALEALGANLAVARLRRKESLATWASRMGVSVPTLTRMESGDPTVSMGVYATALWQVGQDTVLSTLAAPASDSGALELDIREATELGRARARTAENARLMRMANLNKSAEEN